MKIKCIYKSWDALPDYFFMDSGMEKEEFDNYKHIDYHLDLGKEYIVYAITIRDNFFWYCLYETNESKYPTWKPSPFFEVIDSRTSQYWIYSYQKLENDVPVTPIITFSEWANNHPIFYHKLVRLEAPELTVFTQYKELMDVEFE